MTVVVIKHISVVEILEPKNLTTVIAANALVGFSLLVDLVAVHVNLKRSSKF